MRSGLCRGRKGGDMFVCFHRNLSRVWVCCGQAGRWGGSALKTYKKATSNPRGVFSKAAKAAPGNDRKWSRAGPSPQSPQPGTDPAPQGHLLEPPTPPGALGGPGHAHPPPPPPAPVRAEASTRNHFRRRAALWFIVFFSLKLNILCP